MWVFCHIKHALGIRYLVLRFLKVPVFYYSNERSKRHEGQQQQRVLRWCLMNSWKGLYDVAVGGHKGLDSIRRQVSSRLIFLRDFSYLRKERRGKTAWMALCSGGGLSVQFILETSMSRKRQWKKPLRRQEWAKYNRKCSRPRL